ncbi:MAG TPA: vanadium-dependent haloperoxidase [Burkholderiaceae bacterium]|nr:vanadium-dependent haloperoxidase [Burkholderiaceae bacterium]
MTSIHARGFARNRLYLPALAAFAMTACGGGGSVDSPTAQALGAGQSVELVSHGPNLVSRWHEVATTTINVPSTPAGATPEERVGGPDIATLQVAVYDTAMAIAGTHRPFATTPVAPAAGASMEAAINEAAYRVLLGLFPSRSDKYQAMYDTEMAKIPAGPAMALGIALGAEVARATLALRANDGRSVALAPFVPGTTPGAFRGVNPVNRQQPYIRPFVLQSADQFRPGPPPALTSDLYTTDFNEVKAYGGTVSALRTPEQLEIARFNTESPAQQAPRNLRRLATTQDALADNARLLAMLTVAYADATIACFDAKYTYLFWRPQTAIPLADSDANPATVADPTWTPVLPTPNHPEYPAAHGCALGSIAETLRGFHGTKKVAFGWDSTVTGTTRQYATTDDFVREALDARVYGGMHFRNSTETGAHIGRKTAQWMMRDHFEPK